MQVGLRSLNCSIAHNYMYLLPSLALALHSMCYRILRLLRSLSIFSHPLSCMLYVSNDILSHVSTPFYLIVSPNSAHGYCLLNINCQCFTSLRGDPEWIGPDCSLRACPHDIAWVGYVVGANDLHPRMECSN